jgi:heme/copper-type cytochrome/quinol oxidase subunit 3
MSVAAQAGDGGHVAAVHHGHEGSYGETPAIIASRQRMAVYLFLAADAVFVVCLVFTYFYLRALNVNGAWLPAGVQTASAAMTWTIAVVAVLSAIAYVWGASAGDGPFRVGTLIGLLLVLVDVVLQIVQIGTVPFHSQNGAYASAFLVMAGYHIVHLLILLFLGAGMAIRDSRGRLDGDRSNEPRLVSYVWGWFAITAVIFATTLMFTAAHS